MTPIERRKMPTAYELYHTVPELKQRIAAGSIASSPPDNLQDIETRFSELLLSWEAVIKAEICLELADARLSEEDFLSPGPDVKEFDLAACILECPRCQMMLFGWHDAKEHHCCPQVGDLDPPALASSVDYDWYHEYITEPHMLCTALVPFIDEVLELLDLDTEIATVQEVDALDPIIRCTVCKGRDDGKQEYFTWRSYVSL